MLTRQLILASRVFVLMLVAFACVSLDAQVLSPPKVTTKKVATVNIQGVVVDTKKYSFTVKTKDGMVTVKPTEKAIVTLRLNRPSIDLEKSRVRVFRSAPTSQESDSEAAGKAEPIFYDLPQPVYMVSKFKDSGQVKRIMGMKVKRINNYLLTGTNPGDLDPTEKQLLIGGEIKPSKDATNLNLEVGDKAYPVKLGFRRASMTGFSINALVPNETEVFIWGTVEADQSILSNRIEFQPIQTPSSK